MKNWYTYNIHNIFVTFDTNIWSKPSLINDQIHISSLQFFIEMNYRIFVGKKVTKRAQSSKLTDVSHHKGELSFVSKLRLQLIYDLWESCHKICGIIFHSENSNIITYERSRTNSFFAFKVARAQNGGRPILRIYSRAKNFEVMKKKLS